MRHALLALVASGCTIGGSASVVGRWQAKRVIDSTACVQNNAPGGGCGKQIAIGRDIPARSFASLAFTFPATGYMQIRTGDKVEHRVTFASYFEYIRGRGRFALGARVGAQAADTFNDRLLLLTPVSVLAHVGGFWGSVYAGIGYSPVAYDQKYVIEGEMTISQPPVYRHNSVHAFAGTRFWLRRDLERGVTFNPEFRIDRFGDSTLTSLIGNIGIHF